MISVIIQNGRFIMTNHALVINKNFPPFKHRMRFVWSCMFGLSLGLSTSYSIAASTDYVALVAPVAQQQPEALMRAGLQSLSDANKSLSQRWLSDAMSITVTHENDALTDNLDTQNWAAGLEFSVLLPKQKESLKGVSEAYQSQLTVQQEYLNWLASGKLRQLTWAYKKAQVEADLAESAFKNSLELKENVKRKVEVGDSAQLDLLLAEKFVLEQQALAEQKLGQLNLIKKEFSFWTNQSELPQEIVEHRQSSLPLHKHPELRWIQSAYDVSKAQYAQQKTMNQDGPSFFVGAQNDKNRAEDNTFLFLEVSIPIGKAPMNLVNVAEKKQALQTQRIELKRAEQSLNVAILAADQAILMSEKRRVLAEKQNQIAQETLRLAEQSYQLGESSIQSLLLIKKDALVARLNVELANASLDQTIANANQVKGYPLVMQGNSSTVLERGNK